MIGKTITHYKILEKLGEGGMGVVYKAQDTKLKREVAIKFLPRQISASDEERERFKIEAQAAAALNHANIATIHNIEEVDDEIFIVMEYIKGHELKDKIDAGPVPINEVLEIALDIAKGLQIAHEAGVVHRDIKSANIMLTDRGEVKVMDFGLAKRGSQTKITKEGTTLGTIAYMSPEQGRGDDVDQRSDIFSLGVLIYEMLTGQLPFKGEYDQAVTYSVMNEDPLPVTALRTGIPMELERIVNKCLEKDASDRYQRGDELIVDLRKLKKTTETQEILSQSGIKPDVPTSKRPAYVLPAIIALVIVVAIAGFWFINREPEVTERVPIAVVDFINETDEKALNGLSGMLITSLEQSRHLSVMSRARMFDELKKMGREDVTFVDEATGREIARQANLAALAVATIRKLGETYTIDFKVMDPESGDYLFVTKEEGRGQDSVIGMIDRLSEKTRIDLKEETRVVQMASQGIGSVTTTNLEAYHHFFLGEQLLDRLKFENAQDEYRQAIALDSTFGLAYYRLAYAISWWSDGELPAKEPLRKALTLIDRIPEKEQYQVRALNAKMSGGYAAAMPILKEMEQVYPHDKEMLFNIGDYANHTDQYLEAAAYLEKVLRIDPKHVRALHHLAWTYFHMKRYKEMREMANRLASVDKIEAFRIFARYHQSLGEYETAAEYIEKTIPLDSPDVGANGLLGLYWSSKQYKKALEFANKRLSQHKTSNAYLNLAEAYLQMGDLSNALRIHQLGLRDFPGNPKLLSGVGHVYELSGEYHKAEACFKSMTEPHQPLSVRKEGFLALSYFYPYLGKYSEMMKMFDERIAFYWSNNDTNSVARYTAMRANWMFWGRKNRDAALAEIKKTLRFNTTSSSYFGELALFYAELGDTEKVSQTIKRGISEGLQFWVEASLHIALGEWEEAIGKNERQIREGDRSEAPFTSYRAARCYFALGELDRAIAEVIKSQSSHGYTRSFTYPQGFYLLGRIYEKKGDIKLAMENYKKFLDLWKDADEDLPDLIDAKARLAKLNGGG